MSKKIAIIGAGLSGLVLAQKLSDKFQVEVFEKARGVGGRLATRYAEEYKFDHGAQYFTAHSQEFKKFVSELEEKEIVGKWLANFAEIDKNKTIRTTQWTNETPHYVGIPRMNAIGKYLAEGLNVKIQTRIKEIKDSRNKWILVDENSQEFGNYELVILSIPSHQAVDLLPESFSSLSEIRNKKMDGCFTLMLGFKENINLQWQAALVKNSDVSWISINSSKPQRNEPFSMVALSSNKWAEENIELDQEIAKNHLLKTASEICEHDLSKANHSVIHRWRYANTGDNKIGEQFYFDKNLGIAVCGDWCSKGIVEEAYLNANALANVIQ